MGATPEQLRNHAVLDALAVLADIRAELRPVELRLDQRARTPDEHLDRRIIAEQRERLSRAIAMIALLTPDRRGER